MPRILSKASGSKARGSKAIRTWVVCLGLSVFTPACGFLDDELAMSDEEFEASFGDAVGVSSSGGGRGGRSHTSGCGIGLGYASHSHHSAHHHSIGRLVTRNGARAAVIDMAPTHIWVRLLFASQAGSVNTVAQRVFDEDNEEVSDVPYYAAGELQTWGDYLEAELERARLRANSTR